MSAVEIFIGHFGSGKTEIALNRAVEAASRGEKVHVVDLDIVKPYFRSREVGSFLKTMGVNLVIPQGGLENSDLPVVTPRVLGTLTSADGKIIVDVGGDAQGATALGSFAPLLKQKGYQMFFVLNPYRPFTGDIPATRAMLREIEVSARLKVSGIISNPNLGRDTTIHDLREGYAKVKEIAIALELPILYTAVSKKYFDYMRSEGEGLFLEVTNYLLPPWEYEEGQACQMDPYLRLPQMRREVHAES